MRCVSPAGAGTRGWRRAPGSPSVRREETRRESQRRRLSCGGAMPRGSLVDKHAVSRHIILRNLCNGTRAMQEALRKDKAVVEGRNEHHASDLRTALDWL